MFESLVILNVSKTKLRKHRNRNMFESLVILNVSKTKF